MLLKKIHPTFDGLSTPVAHYVGISALFRTNGAHRLPTGCLALCVVANGKIQDELEPTTFMALVLRVFDTCLDNVVKLVGIVAP